MNLKGTDTEKNLIRAFAGESQARNRYEFFAKQAKKEGYVHEGTNAPKLCPLCQHGQGYFEVRH